MRKLAAGECDATLLWDTRLRRIGEAGAITSILSIEEMLPAVSQGAIGIECRADDLRTRGLLVPLHHAEGESCIAAERSLLAALGDSRRTPIAGLDQLNGEALSLRALVTSPDGACHHRANRQGLIDEAAALGSDSGPELRAAAGSNFFIAAV